MRQTNNTTNTEIKNGCNQMEKSQSRGMKNSLFTLLFSIVLIIPLLMMNCGQQSHQHEADEHEGHEHAQGETQEHDHEHEAGEAGHDHGAGSTLPCVHVKPEIIKRWGLKYASPELKEYVEKIALTGVLKENKNTTFIINARVGGTVTALKKDIGDRVKKGDTLCILNSNELLELKTRYIKAFQEYRQTRENFQRTQSLFKIKAIEKKELMSRETAYKTALAEYFSLESELETVGFSKKELEAVRNAVKQDKTDRLKTFLTPYYHIPSPGPGIVVARDLNLGERVENDKLIYEVSDTAKLWAILDATEKDLPFIEKGSPVLVESDVYPQKQFKGTVLTMLEKIDPELRTVKVRVEVDNSAGDLKQEMYVRGKLAKKIKKQFQCIPAAALVKLSGVDGVFVIDEDGFLFKTVQVVDIDSTGFAFIKGLSEEDMVITEGSFYLKAECEIQSGSAADPHAGHSH